MDEPIGSTKLEPNGTPFPWVLTLRSSRSKVVMRFSSEDAAKAAQTFARSLWTQIYEHYDG